LSRLPSAFESAYYRSVAESMRSARSPAAIIVIGPVPPPVHGAALITAALISRLRVSGASVCVVDTGGTSPASRIRYHLTRTLAHARASKVLWSERHQVDKALYIAGAGGSGLWYQATVALFARILGYRIVFHHHSFSYLRRRQLAMIALTFSAGMSAYHVTLCECMRRDLTRRYRSVGRVLVCSNAGLLDRLEAGPTVRARKRTRPTPAEPLVLGHLSNLSVEKGLEVVFETLRAFVAGTVPARLLLAGAPADPFTAKLVKDAQREFGRALVYRGPLERNEVDAFLKQLDMFLFPSTYSHEAEPLVVLEAMRCGVPVIAFDVGCLSDLVSRGWAVPESVNFPQTAVRLADQMLRSPMREDLRIATEKKFAVRHEQGAKARDILLALLAGPHRTP
jgi:glycosyltransferase involved in cell wall biosynthesis